MPKILVTAFDDEFCDEVAKVLGSKGIHTHCGNRVVSIDGNSQVESVTLENGKNIKADMVLVSIGAKPANELAQKAGLRIVENGSIWVDEYMRTDAEDVFAVSGGPSAGELINMIALAIQKKVTVRELDMLQIATHPLLTSAPTVHPLINAAHQALAKLRATIRELPALKKVA